MFLKIRALWNVVRHFLRESYNVLIDGSLKDDSQFITVNDGVVFDELTRHAETVNIEECRCRKCFAYLLRRNKQLEKENEDFRRQWCRIYGRYKNGPTKLSCYVARNKDGTISSEDKII